MTTSRSAHSDRPDQPDSAPRPGPIGNALQQLAALSRFLAVPLFVVALFLLLALVTYHLDSQLNKSALRHSAALGFLEDLFGDRQSTRDLLATLASALITVTSITFSLLLVAVQQSASTFSNQILDQFLHRKTNQFYFGFFVGLSLFTLVELATIKDLHHPLFGALVAILLTVVALILILVLIWTTIDQIRSTNVVGDIGTMIRTARAGERRLLGRTRAKPAGTFAHHRPVRHPHAGIVSAIALDRLEKLLGDGALEGRCELVVHASRGTYVSGGDTVAEIRSSAAIPERAWDDLARAVLGCWTLRRQARPENDPRIGMNQLATIGWNSTSSARSNPQPPITVCRTITEILWDEARNPPERRPESLIVYPDMLFEDGLATIETIVTAAAEARQHQTAAAAYDSYARLLPVLPPDLQQRVAWAASLSLPMLRMHVPTITLQHALARLAAALDEVGSPVGAMFRTVLDRAASHARFAEDIRVHPPFEVSAAGVQERLP